MINGIHHVAISTPDIERMKSFYVEQLGLELVGEVAWPQGTELSDTILELESSSANLTMLRAGNAYLELFQYHTPPPAVQSANRPVCDHGITHVCFDVTDVDGEYARLKAVGMRFHSEPQWVGEGVRTVYGRDPDGNVVELQEVLQKENPIALP